jgi:hypothetical protein
MLRSAANQRGAISDPEDKIAMQKSSETKTRMEAKMADELQLDEFQAYLLAEDHSPLTITGYVGDVRLFAQWYEKQYGDVTRSWLFDQ